MKKDHNYIGTEKDHKKSKQQNHKHFAEMEYAMLLKKRKEERAGESQKMMSSPD